ncbi:MAG: hypothetical protein ACI9WC_000684 [Arenicella sp.]
MGHPNRALEDYEPHYNEYRPHDKPLDLDTPLEYYAKMKEAIPPLLVSLDGPMINESIF